MLTAGFWITLPTVWSVC